LRGHIHKAHGAYPLQLAGHPLRTAVATPAQTLGVGVLGTKQLHNGCRCTRAGSTDWNQFTRLQSETLALKGSPLLALAAVRLHFAVLRHSAQTVERQGFTQHSGCRSPRLSAGCPLRTMHRSYGTHSPDILCCSLRFSQSRRPLLHHGLCSNKPSLLRLLGSKCMSSNRRLAWLGLLLLVDINTKWEYVTFRVWLLHLFGQAAEAPREPLGGLPPCVPLVPGHHEPHLVAKRIRV
jgi:hypothetical protein